MDGLVPGLGSVCGYPWSIEWTHDRVTFGGEMFALVRFVGFDSWGGLCPTTDVVPARWQEDLRYVFLMVSTHVRLRILGVNPL